MFDKLREEYRSSLKSMDTEEHIDLYFYRPVGFAWACLFRKLHITPNAVTIASIFIGIGAGICLYPPVMWINLIGMLLLVWANSYDSADGQLARLTKQYSRIGRILDGVAGDFWFISIYVAICLRAVHATDGVFSEYPQTVWILASLAGICHARQAAVADTYRQLHLFFVKGSVGSELDSSASIRETLSTLSWSKDFSRKLILSFYHSYTRAQEAGAPSMQKLRAAILKAYPDGILPADLSAEFRKMSLPLCKWENFLTFNWRAITLFVSVLAGMPWLYFVTELTVFNAVMVYLILRHESMCRRMIAIIADRNNG